MQRTIISCDVKILNKKTLLKVHSRGGVEHSSCQLGQSHKSKLAVVNNHLLNLNLFSRNIQLFFTTDNVGRNAIIYKGHTSVEASVQCNYRESFSFPSHYRTRREKDKRLGRQTHE
jgi:hypothetical protein